MHMYSFRRIIKACRWFFFGQPWQKRRVRHECARLAASVFGDYPVSDDYKRWRDDTEFLRNYRRLNPNNYFSEDRKYALRELARSTKDLEGVIAECGCYEGASSWFIADALPGITFYIFDSFEGLSEPGKKDLVQDENYQNWNQGDMESSESMLRNNLREFENIHVLKGWIPERFNEVETERFRFVHIDLDLYDPTYASLEFFYPRTTGGGIIVLDDYGSTKCPGAFDAVNDYMQDKREYVVHLPTAQGVIIKRNSV